MLEGILGVRGFQKAFPFRNPRLAPCPLPSSRRLFPNYHRSPLLGPEKWEGRWFLALLNLSFSLFSNGDVVEISEGLTRHLQETKVVDHDTGYSLLVVTFFSREREREGGGNLEKKRGLT